MKPFDEIKKQGLRLVLEDNGWNIPDAAIELDTTRATIYRLVKRYKLMKPGPAVVRRLVKA